MVSLHGLGEEAVVIQWQQTKLGKAKEFKINIKGQRKTHNIRDFLKEELSLSWRFVSLCVLIQLSQDVFNPLSQILIFLHSCAESKRYYKL